MSSLLLAAVTVLLLFSAAVAAVDLNSGNSMFVLGDSSVRCGGYNLFFPPFNVAINLSNFESRSCSRLLHDVIAEKMGLPPVPLFNGSSNIDTIQVISNGVNFGSFDGTVLTELPNYLLFQGLHHQVSLVYDTIQSMQLALGPKKALEITSNAVFWLSFGKDDYLDLILQDTRPRVISKYGRRGFAALLVPQIIQAMEDLYNTGVRKMVVAGLLPLGCSPWAVFNKKACVKEMNNLVKSFNELLSNNIHALNQRFPDANLVFCDVYLGMVEMIVYPHLYGFEDVSNACCGMKGFEGLIGGCLSKKMSCKMPSTHVWWDVYTPSTSVNELLAKWAWSGGGRRRISREMSLSMLTHSR